MVSSIQCSVAGCKEKAVWVHVMHKRGEAIGIITDAKACEEHTPLSLDVRNANIAMDLLGIKEKSDVCFVIIPVSERPHEYYKTTWYLREPVSFELTGVL